MNAATFAAYRAATNSREARRLLCVLVQSYDYVVARHARAAGGVFGDLVQAGRMALADAFEAYDPARGNFVRFAERRIIRAMYLS